MTFQTNWLDAYFAMVLPITRLATTGSSIGLTRRAWLNDLMSHLKAFSIMDAILRPIATLRNWSSKEFYLRVLAPVILVCRTVDLQTGKTLPTLILSSMQMSCWRCGKVGLRTG